MARHGYRASSQQPNRDIMPASSTATITTILIASIVLSLACLLDSTQAADLRGSLRITATQSDAADDQTETLNQQHSLSWNRRLTPYLSLGAAWSYGSFSSNLGEGTNTWRKQVRPTTELRWSHPAFTFALSAHRRESTSQAETTDLVQRELTSRLSTRLENFPLLSARVVVGESYNRFDRATRDTRSQTYQLTADHQIGPGSLHYSVVRQEKNVISSGLKVIQTRHQAHWLANADLIDDRLKINGRYGLSYTRQTDILLSADSTVRPIDILAGMHSVDATPKLGSLTSLPALIDGNRADSTSPAIEIGQGSVDQNIGVDFGFIRAVRELYIYTDGPSGSTLNWLVYTSVDNLTWTESLARTEVRYNAAFSRYELRIDDLEARYLKVVNQGINDILSVRVTEIEALELFTADRKAERARTLHRIEFGARYNASPTVDLTFDMNYRLEPGSDFSSSRNQFSSIFASTHRPTDKLTQVFRLQFDRTSIKAAARVENNVAGSYSLSLTPLQAASVRLSLLTIQNSLAGARFTENNNVALRTELGLFANLSVQIDGRYGRFNQFVSDQKFDSWSGRFAATSALTRSIDLTGAATYQMTEDLGLNRITIRRSADGSLTWRLTSSIIVSSSLSGTKDDRHLSWVQMHTFSWSLSRSLSIGGLLDLAETDSFTTRRRENLHFNYSLNGRTSFNGGFNRTRNAIDGSETVISWQLGIRSGF